MQGPASEDCVFEYETRGLIPRTLEYIFNVISASSDKIEYSCKCSYVEIYNEIVYDLLDSKTSVCNLRENANGIFIEGAIERRVQSPQDAFDVLNFGAKSRHVAATNMNRESSRSHSIFTLFIHSRSKDTGITDIRESRFNLVDLAGSERQEHTGNTGTRIKEAGNINRSLSNLGNVINALVDSANGRARHVHYRDSKLTLLLKDSVGGNAKTFIIANISPAIVYASETLSTLKFAQRAKLIRNKAIVNKDIEGTVDELQAEIKRLNQELCKFKDSKVFTEETEVPKPESEIFYASLRNQHKMASELESLSLKVESLSELTKKKDSFIQSQKMMIKFRDSSLQMKLRTVDEKYNEHLKVLKGDIEELRKQLESNPEVTRFAHDNLLLREQLEQYASLAQKLENFEQIEESHRCEIQGLNAHILKLVEENEKLRQGFSPEANEQLELEFESAKEDWTRKEKSFAEEIQVLKQSLLQLEQDQQSMKEEFEENNENDINQLQSKLSESESKIQNLEIGLKELQDENTNLRKSIQEAQDALQASESEKYQMKRELQAQVHSFNDLLNQMKDLRTKKLEVANQNSELTAKFAALEYEHKEKVYSLEKRISFLESRSNDPSNSENTNRCSKLEGEIDNLKRENQILAEEKRNLRQELRRSSILSETEKEWEIKYNEISESEKQLQGKFSDLEKMYFTERARAGSAQVDLDYALEENKNLAEKTSKLLSEIETLRGKIACMEIIKNENNQLKEEHSKLAQHQNSKQKIQYHSQIKEENNRLKEELQSANVELKKLNMKLKEYDQIVKRVKK